MAIKRRKVRREGRPSKRTARLTKKISDAIAMGLSYADAAAHVHISDDTLLRWRQIPEFEDAIKGAVATRKLKRLQKIESGKNFFGAAWLMERTEKERWAKPEIQLQINQQFNVNKPHDSAYFLAREEERDFIKSITDINTEGPAELPVPVRDISSDTMSPEQDCLDSPIGDNQPPVTPQDDDEPDLAARYPGLAPQVEYSEGINARAELVKTPEGLFLRPKSGVSKPNPGRRGWIKANASKPDVTHSPLEPY